MGGLIPQASTYAAAVDSLFSLVLVVTGIAFVLVEGTLIFFLIRYRYREGRKAEYTHGSRRIELTWTIIPAIGLIGLAILQYGLWTSIKVDLPDDPDALTIDVMANQFEWVTTYPGADGVLDTADDITAPINIAHYPVNRTVIIRLGSEDVLHSFFIPELRVKQDAVPGRPFTFWFEANLTGQFEIACAELCGLGHYRMRGRVTVETQAEFDTWLAEIEARQAQ